MTREVRGVQAALTGLLAGLLAAPAARADCAVLPGSTWKNTIQFPNEGFLVDGTSDSNPGWVKFTMLLCDPFTAYYQNGNVLPFHYDFGSQFIQPFVGITPVQFEQYTLYNDTREAIIGTVIFPPLEGDPIFGFPVADEVGIQLIANDPLPLEQIIEVFTLVQSTITSHLEVTAYYFPTFEQQNPAEAMAADLAAAGIQISSVDRWSEGNTCYSEGWALGRIVYVPAGEVDTAYLSGNLTADDILLTDGIPIDLPIVAGIMSLAPATPSSHVAILANTYNVPFVHLALDDDRQKAQALVGRRAILEAYDDVSVCQFDLIDVEDDLDQATVDEILQLKQPPPLDIDVTEPFGAISANVDSLTLQDIRYFGGKATGYSVLRQSIPDNARVATALSFDLWEAFLDQAVPSGLTLRQEIAQRLDGHVFPADPMTLAFDLAGVRAMIENQTSFTPALEQAIIQTLQDPQYGFDPLQKIRFRSSTNVEDSAQFTGAGLYDSYSGCLADDLDGDTVGPSLCDPTDSNERGVFRAIRKVFASFYNVNAYVERLRFGVNENDVGMALLVHHSFPDPIELANGVATARREDNGTLVIDLVTQTGAISVTNPAVPGAIPEEVRIHVPGTFNPPQVLTPSNLVLLGETVMNWPGEYTDLADLIALVAAQWQTVTGQSEFVLDLEYKKIEPGEQLVIKQVRSIPQPDDTPSIAPFLVSRPLDLCDSYNGISGLRQRVTLQLDVQSMWLTAENLQSSLYTDAYMEYTDGCQLRSIDGPPSSWPEASFSYNGSTAFDTWRFDDLPNPRTYTMHTNGLPSLVAPSQSPFITADDLSFFFFIESDEPVISGGGQSTTTEFASPLPCAENLQDHLTGRYYEIDGVIIETEFYQGPPGSILFEQPGRFLEWKTATVTGLISEPLIVEGYWAGGYNALNHHFGEFTFLAPKLSSALTSTARAELDTLNIHLIEVAQDNIHGTTSLNLYSETDVGEDCSGVTDCNFNLFADANDLETGLSTDCNGNGVLDDCEDHCSGDVDRDCAVDVDDLVAVILAWGSGDPLADVDGSGIVDVDDLITVVLGFGGC